MSGSDAVRGEISGRRSSQCPNILAYLTAHFFSLAIVLTSLTGCKDPYQAATLDDYGVKAASATSDRPDATSTPIAQQRTTEVALNSGWVVQPAEVITHAEFRNGQVEVKAHLEHPDDYAEVFFDLRGLELGEIPSTPEGAYDLRQMEIIATVRADDGFRGTPAAANGVQIMVKDSSWRTQAGNWLNVTGSIEGPGTRVFMEVPDNAIGKSVIGLTVKFGLNSKSSAGFDGHLYLTSLHIRPLQRN
jgi:hypothetical protein